MDSLLNDISRTAINPALAMLPARMDSARARVQMLAIGLQESRLVARVQGGGPAHGLWQFEQGGVTGVLSHPASKPWAFAVCAARIADPLPAAVYDRLPTDDILAAAFARLLLWTDPSPLPALGDAQAAWDLYARTWRPGKPRRESWDAFYDQALNAVGAP